MIYFLILCVMEKKSMKSKVFFRVVKSMFKQAIAVFIKEMKCILRDKRTFIFGLLLPLILVPTMLLIGDFSISGLQKNGIDHATIAMNDKNNSFYSFLSEQDSITIVDVKNYQKSLDSGEISAYIIVDKDLDEKIIKHENFDLDIKYGESSINSVSTLPIIKQYESTYRYLAERCTLDNTDTLRRNFHIKVPLDNTAVNMPTIDTSSLYFSMLVPMTLVIYCCMGSAGTASELSAGEKERGTLEPLLSTSANRTGIIIGKLFATTAMGVTSGLCTAVGLWGYLIISGGAAKNHISALGMILLLLTTVFASMFFASINLLIGVYAKSYKEAQTYMMPLSLLCVIPSMFSYTLEASKIGIIELCIPMYNVVCIIKEILVGTFNVAHILIVLLWLTMYTSVMLYMIIKLFKKESVLFRV